MYILHIPLLWWAVGWRMRFAPEIYVAMVIALSALVYRWIEEPANRYLRGRVSASRGPRVREPAPAPAAAPSAG
jgi:peptidoglycan/LPS O-acetylase OafA/YrhL